MESVQFRINSGALEYRSLIIQERNVYKNSEPSGEELHIDWQNQYTDWKPVPSVENNQQTRIYNKPDRYGLWYLYNPALQQWFLYYVDVALPDNILLICMRSGAYEDFDDFKFTACIPVDWSLPKLCSGCNGLGKIPVSNDKSKMEWVKCDQCNGVGLKT